VRKTTQVDHPQEAPTYDKLLALPTNITLGRKGLPGQTLVNAIVCGQSQEPTLEWST
jgi:hypothetical protein